MRVIGLLALTLLAAVNPETLSERSQSRARSILDEAVVAIGGAEALQSIKSVRIELEGKTWPRLQMTTPEPPFENGTFHEKLFFDLDTNRVHLEQRNAIAGFDGHNTTILEPAGGNNYDHRARTRTPIPAAQLTGQQFIQYHRRLPHLLLRQALANPNSLRHLGDDQHEGRPHQVITFVMPDTQQVALYIDAKTKLVSKYELVFTDPLTGEDASEVMFSDYAASGSLKVPRKWAWRIAGDPVASYSVKSEINPPVTEATFQVAATDYGELPADPPVPAPGVEQLGEGVYLIQNVAGPNQHTLAVAFRDYILAVEAPGSNEGTAAVIRRIKETIPGKPIRYIAMTHHHGDHIGGLRSFIAEGATVVTTAGNRRVVEAMGPKPEFLFLENGKRVFKDGEQTVELIDIGPNPHAKEMVIAYLPRQRILFQGDLFNLPPNAPLPPPQASALALAAWLKSTALPVDHIVGVHGRPATRCQVLNCESATPVGS